MPMSQSHLTTQLSRRFVLETQISLTYTDMCFARPWNYTMESWELLPNLRGGHSYPELTRSCSFMHYYGTADGSHVVSAPWARWGNADLPQRAGCGWTVPLTAAGGLSICFCLVCSERFFSSTGAGKGKVWTGAGVLWHAASLRTQRVGIQGLILTLPSELFETKQVWATRIWYCFSPGDSLVALPNTEE